MLELVGRKMHDAKIDPLNLITFCEIVLFEDSDDVEENWFGILDTLLYCCDIPHRRIYHV